MEQFIQDITREAGQAILPMFKNVGVKYTKKDVSDVVTEADLLSNKMLVEAIRSQYPDHGIVSEEIPEEEWEIEKEYVWILDPLDGTRNFSKHVPLFGVIVALARKGKIELAAIHLPVGDELFFAKRDGGAFLNGKKIQATAQDTLEQTYGAVWGDFIEDRTIEIANCLVEHCSEKKYWFSALGSMGVVLSYVTAGRRDWYVGRAGCGVWDVAAPYLLLEEVGCKVTDSYGEPFDPWKSSDILAANPGIHAELIGLLSTQKTPS